MEKTGDEKESEIANLKQQLDTHEGNIRELQKARMGHHIGPHTPRRIETENNSIATIKARLRELGVYTI